MKKIIYALVLLLPVYWSLSGQEVVEVIEPEELMPGLYILKATDGRADGLKNSSNNEVWTEQKPFLLPYKKKIK